MPRLLFGLQSAFSLWMLVDAARRGAAYYWYPIIMLPFGELVYFFSVKIHDPEFLWLKMALHRLTTRKVTIEQLRFRTENSPSYENQVALAQALHDRKEFAEAAELFEKVLGSYGESSEALFGLAHCQVGMGNHAAAVKTLRALLALEPAYEDYHPWAMLADSLHRAGRLEEALEVTAQLVEKSPRLNHRIYYAHYLRLSEKRAESRRQLEIALMEHQNAPRFLRRRQGSWARQAKQLLRQMA